MPLQQARLLLEDPVCSGEILGAWDALLPAALARFGARLALLQAFLEGFRTGLFVKDRVRGPGLDAWDPDLHCGQSGKGVLCID